MDTKKLLLRIGLVALIIRVLYLIQHAGSPFFGRALLDQHYYDLCARQLAGAGGNLIDGFRPLLYPLFASLFYRIDPDSGIFLTTVIQHVLGIGMTMMIAWLASRFFTSIKAGAVAGFLFALSAPPLYFEGELLIATLFSFLLLLLWVLYLAACETASIRRAILLWLGAGATLGLAAQARPNALPLLLCFPLISFFRFVRTMKRRSKDTPPYPPNVQGRDEYPYSSPKVGTTIPSRPQQRSKDTPPYPSTIFLPLIALVSTLILQIAFNMLNAHYSGTFSLTTQAGGINFYLGNGERADGMIPRQSRHVVYEGAYQDPIQIMAEQDYQRETGDYGPVDQRKVSRFWTQKTIEEIKQNPTRWIGLILKKAWLLIWNHEVPNNRSLSFAASEETPLLKWLPVRWWLLITLLPWGIAALIKSRKIETAVWAGSFLLLFAGTIALFFVNSRFRVPLWPGLSILGGGGVVYLWSLVKNRQKPPLAALLCSVLFCALSLINWFHIPDDSIENDLSMRAGIRLELGQYESALDDIGRCIEIAPNNPRYYFVQGNIFLAMKTPLAIESYLKAIALNPSDPMFHSNLGVALEDAGEFETAEKAYRKALELQPNHQAAQINLMLLMLRSGNLEQAQSMLASLIAAAPQNPTLLCAKALLAYKLSGDEAALREAEQLNPELTRQMTAP